MLVGFIGVSNGLYLARNESSLSRTTRGDLTVHPLDVKGYRVLGSLVRPDERVMNDRKDGSVWMYALDGVHPVAGHFDQTSIGPDATLLAQRLNQYDIAPDVQAAAARLRVHWILTEHNSDQTSTVPADQEPGLKGIERVQALTLVYANPRVTICRLAPTGPQVESGPPPT